MTEYIVHAELRRPVVARINAASLAEAFAAAAALEAEGWSAASDTPTAIFPTHATLTPDGEAPSDPPPPTADETVWRVVARADGWYVTHVVARSVTEAVRRADDAEWGLSEAEPEVGDIVQAVEVSSGRVFDDTAIQAAFDAETLHPGS